VEVGGVAVKKPAMLVGPDAQLAVSGREVDYISRGAVKLGAALDHFALEPKGRIALDVGASTGGFTQMLLERGAIRVYAVENGSNQLHQKLAGDARVI